MISSVTIENPSSDNSVVASEQQSLVLDKRRTSRQIATFNVVNQGELIIEAPDFATRFKVYSINGVVLGSGAVVNGNAQLSVNNAMGVLLVEFMTSN